MGAREIQTLEESAMHLHDILPKLDTYTVWKEANVGIDARLIDGLLAPLGFSRAEVAALFSINVKTLNKYILAKQVLGPMESELILKAAKLGITGVEVFGGAEEFQAWLSLPAFGFDFKIPKSMLTSHAGFDLVQIELDNIAYGDLA